MPETYRDGDGTIFMVGLSPQQEVLLTYLGTARTASGWASACGPVTVKGTGGIPVSDTIKVDNPFNPSTLQLSFSTSTFLLPLKAQVLVFAP